MSFRPGSKMHNCKGQAQLETELIYPTTDLFSGFGKWHLREDP